MNFLVPKDAYQIPYSSTREFAFCSLDLRLVAKALGAILIEKTDDFETSYCALFEADGSEVLMLASKIFVEKGFSLWSSPGREEVMFQKIQGAIENSFGSSSTLNRIRYSHE